MRAIQVRVHRPTAARLDLIYGVQGDIARLLVPPTSEPRRTDGLWQHTCFEVFLATGEGPAYYEFNFSPSTQWAAYRFDSYRKGMNPVVSLSWPRVYVDRDADRFTLSAALDLESLPDLTGTSLARLALTAVIEDTDHHISYWAVAHPSGTPDFHHSDAFALTLPGPSTLPGEYPGDQERSR